MKIESVFKQGENIPKKYTCDAQDLSPELKILDVPEGTKTFAIIVDDPDAPSGTWVHWVVWNIPGEKTVISEGEKAGILGITDFKRLGYGGPCPPPGPSHTYRFKVYALDTKLDLQQGATKFQLKDAMKGHILENAELDGEYQR